MYFYNRENGLGIGIETLPGQKRPGLMMIDELGSKKVAIFIKDEDAEDFMAHLEKFLEANRKGGGND